MFIFFVFKISVCFVENVLEKKGKYGKIKKSVVIEPSRSGGGYMVILEMNNSHTQDIF